MLKKIYIWKSNIKFIINNNILKKTKVTFGQNSPLHSFNDLKSSIIESELKLVAISFQWKSTQLPVTIKTSESSHLLGFLLKDSTINNMQHLLMMNTLTMKEIS